MLARSKFWVPLVAIFLGASLLLGIDAKLMRKDELHARQLEAAKRFRSMKRDAAAGLGPQNITFTNPLASQYYVDGANIPLVDWDVGPSWAGLIPISGDPNETRKLFFWFFPPGPQGSLDDIIFWTNGGPGCSSLEGFLQENGPISWGYGQAGPTQNPTSWTNLSSVLWVEQPVGTGYSQGVPNIQDEVDLSAQLVGFFQQFLEIFSELQGKKLWLSGESYAGTYVPYIADYIMNNSSALNLDLQGIWMADPYVSWNVIQEEVVAVDFVQKYENVFSFNQTFMNYLETTAQECNYAGYYDKYVTYPPPQAPFPLPGDSTNFADGCDVWTDIFNAALLQNPAFNVYRIFDTYPILWDVLGFPGSFPQAQTPLYFNRTDVKEILHVPTSSNWEECSSINVFPDGDASLPSALSVLPSVIEKANSTRTVVVHGLADFILIAEGTRIVIQNMTWGGQQGFQTAPTNDSFLVDAMGISLGTVHTERGLTYYEVELSGHMVPQFSPLAAYQSMEFLMGKRSTP